MVTFKRENEDENVGDNRLLARDEPVVGEELATSFETIHDTLFRAGRALSGYF